MKRGMKRKKEWVECRPYIHSAEEDREGERKTSRLLR